MAEWDFDWYRERIVAETERLGGDADLASLAVSPVPTCPGWTVTDLIRHVGMVHRWAERIVSTRATTPVDQGEIDTTLPTDPDQYGAWLTAGARALASTLREAGPDAECWTRVPGQRARWWARRGTYETIVHRADLVITAGHEPALDAGESADGIDELLSNLPYGRRTKASMADLPADGETLHLHATDSDGEWMIILGPDGMAWERGHGKGDVAVRGPVSRLLLLVYGRADPEDSRFQIFGDRDLLATWLAKTAL